MHTFRVTFTIDIEAADAGAAADAAAWLAAVLVKDRRHLSAGAALTAIAVSEPVTTGMAVAYAADEVALLREVASQAGAPQ